MTREERREYNRKYYAANAGRCRELCKNYRRRSKQQIDARMAKYLLDNRERIAAQKKVWYSNNREKILARCAANRATGAANRARRRAVQHRATPAWSERDRIKEVYVFASDMGYHVDHIVPLRSKSVCGLHVLANLEVIRGERNRSKSNCWWPDMWEPHPKI